MILSAGISMERPMMSPMTPIMTMLGLSGTANPVESKTWMSERHMNGMMSSMNKVAIIKNTK